MRFFPYTLFFYICLKFAKILTPSLPECLIEFCNVALTFESVDQILWRDHSNESSLTVLSHGAICAISQNKIWKFGRNLVLAKLGSERVNNMLEYVRPEIRRRTIYFSPLLLSYKSRKSESRAGITYIVSYMESGCT